MQKIVVMGNDPAKVNYGYAFVSFKIKDNKLKYKVLRCGMLENTLKDLINNPADQLLDMLNEIKGFPEYKKTNHVIIERFVNRGKFLGASNEVVNQMIGAITVLVKSKTVDTSQVMSSTWKNAVAKHFVLDKVTKTSAKLNAGELSLYKMAQKSEVPNHIVDAFLQAAYHAQKSLPFNIYETFNTNKSRELLIKRLANGMSINPNKDKKVPSKNVHVAQPKQKIKK